MRVRPFLLAVALFLGGTPIPAYADLFVSSGNTDQVLRYDGRTGMPVGSGVFVSQGSAGLSVPFSLAFGPNGNLYVADALGVSRVLRFDGTTGAPVGSGVFVGSGSAGLSGPTFLTFSPQQVTAPVPEPGTLLLVGVALLGLLTLGWRRRKF